MSRPPPGTPPPPGARYAPKGAFRTSENSFSILRNRATATPATTCEDSPPDPSRSSAKMPETGGSRSAGQLLPVQRDGGKRTLWRGVFLREHALACPFSLHSRSCQAGGRGRAGRGGPATPGGGRRARRPRPSPSRRRAITAPLSLGGLLLRRGSHPISVPSAYTLSVGLSDRTWERISGWEWVRGSMRPERARSRLSGGEAVMEIPLRWYTILAGGPDTHT